MFRSKANSVMLLQTDVKSPMLEAYSNLRINMSFAAAVQEAKTITVASARPQEGKTTTALNLAVTFASAGKKVMLVDANLRNPSLHVPLGKNNRYGLNDLLSDWSSAVDYIREISDTYIENLSFIASGAPAVNPPELLATNQMDVLLDRLKKSYDVVIIDTPAALEYIDAKIIAAKCDGVLLVVEYSKVKRDTARRLMEEFALVKANVLGAVLNKANRKGKKV